MVRTCLVLSRFAPSKKRKVWGIVNVKPGRDSSIPENYIRTREVIQRLHVPLLQSACILLLACANSGTVHGELLVPMRGMLRVWRNKE